MKPIHEQVIGSGDPLERLARRLAEGLTAHLRSDEVRATTIPGLTLYQRTAPTGPLPFTCQPSVAIVAQGRKRMDLDQESFFYDQSRHLLTSLDLPAVSQVIEASPDKPYLCMVLNLDIALIRELLSQPSLVIKPAPTHGLAMSTGENSAELLDACCRLVDLLDHPEDATIMSAVIQREIHYRILTSLAGMRLRAIATQGTQNHQVARALTWLRENYVRSVRIEELAKLAGMGVSTFHASFRQLTSLSPLQYQKRLRLNSARGRMLLDNLDAASAAFEVGYESASQFSRDYRKHFGNPLGKDIAILRTSGTLAMNLARIS